MTDDHPAIADHGLLSDCHSAALVTSDGAVDWLCAPRFDSPSVFGRILDPEAGHFSVTPRDVTDVSRRYVGRSLVLETTFTTRSGTLVLTDAMVTPCVEGVHDIGRDAPGMLARRIEVAEGEVVVDVTVAPRPEYGVVQPALIACDAGVETRGGADRYAISGDVPFRCGDGTATATVRLVAGDRRRVGLGWGRTFGDAPEFVGPGDIDAALDETLEAWEQWSAHHQNYDGPWAEEVELAGRVLRGLTFQPTGAIVAAPTTSLPEEIGGVRNWDYRYTWLRDASMTLRALWVAACPDEAEDFFEWMVAAAGGAVDGSAAGLQVMFSITGRHDLSERELPHLDGYRDSRPVRIGNAAWSQTQLDVYGEVLLAAHRLRDLIGDLDGPGRRFLAGLADAAASRWREPDHGIWEVRGEPRHFTHSKVMCWAALDRAVRLADLFEVDADRVRNWATVRDEIRAEVLTRSWNPDLGAFTRAYDSAELDASVLLMPVVGIVEPDDGRMLATLDAIEAELTDEAGLVYRYRATDGLAGDEGSFVICTFWLAQARALAGDIDRAAATVSRALGFCNDLGLMAEEIESGTGEMLGNFPQAFSHVGLVNAAWAIAGARGHHRPGSEPA